MIKKHTTTSQTPTKTVDTPSEPSIDGRTESKGVDTNTPRSVKEMIREEEQRLRKTREQYPSLADEVNHQWHMQGYRQALKDLTTLQAKHQEELEGEIRDIKKDHWHLRWEGIGDTEEAQKRREFNEEVTGYINGVVDEVLTLISNRLKS